MPHSLPPYFSSLFFLDSDNENNAQTQAVRGERALWRAVITQALMDAANHSSKPERRYQKRKALEWLTGKNPDFATVCDHAGLDPLYVRAMVKRALQNDCTWRSEAVRRVRKHHTVRTPLPGMLIPFAVPA